MISKIKKPFFIIVTLLALFFPAVGTGIGYAVTTPGDEPNAPPTATESSPYYGTAYSCPEGQTHLTLPDEGSNNRVCCPDGSETDAQDCAVAKYLNPTIKVISVIVGVLVIMGMIIGGIQYSASSGDPQKAAAGKGKIVKAMYGLIAYLFLFSFLQFFSPGGISSKNVPEKKTKDKPTIALRCSKTFLGIKPWYVYLPDSVFANGMDKDDANDTCDIENFNWIPPKNAKAPSNIPAVALAVTDGLLRIAAFVAVAFVIVGGANFVTSQGDPEKAKRAREAVVNALIGLVVAIVATAVVSFIGNRLT